MGKHEQRAVFSLSSSPASASWSVELKAGVQYSLALTSLTRRDVGGMDPLAASLALAHSAARNHSGT